MMPGDIVGGVTSYSVNRYVGLERGGTLCYNASNDNQEEQESNGRIISINRRED